MDEDLRRIVAPNPGPFTGEGTNTWILGTHELCVIDPGPGDPRHLRAILDAMGGARAAAIVVTHAHRDHSALAPALSAATGAPVLAFGDAQAGLRPVPGPLGGGWGVDEAFAPDRTLAHGDVIAGAGWRLRALHTPGHMGNHLCLDDGRRLWTGDQAMGWATSLVSPPEGDMADYMASLEALLSLGPRRLLPGHGEAVEDGAGRLAWLLAHRRAREAEVLAALGEGPAGAVGIASWLYPGLEPGLLPAASRNVLAHLVDLARRGLAAPEGAWSEGAIFRRVGPADPPGRGPTPLL